MEDKLVDYSYPWMMAGQAMKKVHDAVLRKDYDGALDAGLMVIAEAKLMMAALKVMRDKENALRQQA